MPRVTEEEKPLLFGAADIFVSPADNLQECFGQSVVEAMASGIPQLVSDWDGYRDLVVHGETGFLAPTLWGKCDSDLLAAAQVFPGEWKSNHYLMAQAVSVDVPALANHLEELLLNSELRRRMGEQSRERAKSVFDWEVIAARYEALLIELGEISATEKLTRTPSYRKPELFESARHFPTELLAEDTVVVSTGSGAVVDGRPLIPYFNEMQHLNEYSRWNVTEILKRVSSPIRMSALRTNCAATVTCDKDVFTRQVLWLIKYSFLAVVK